MNCSLFMGIRFLNQYFKKECKQGIQQIHLKSLSGKKIAVDTSIYLYKFLADGEEALIENLLTMLNLFKYYKITPIFIFDGKVPAEKKALLEKRKEDKKTAENEYYLLKDKMENTLLEKKGIQQQMDELKKKFVYLKHDQIEMVKKLFDAYGTDYIVSEKEADELCAYLVVEGFVWACLSEDMDMFVYGVLHVLRYLSFVNHNVVLYDLPKILDCLKMNQDELREICVLSGTDYDIQMKTTHNLYSSLDLFKKYNVDKNIISNKSSTTFYNWLMENNNFTNRVEFEKLLEIKNRFDINKSEHSCKFQKELQKINVFKNKNMVKKTLEDLLKYHGFLF